MIDIKILRTEPDRVRENLKKNSRNQNFLWLMS